MSGFWALLVRINDSGGTILAVSPTDQPGQPTPEARPFWRKFVSLLWIGMGLYEMLHDRRPLHGLTWLFAGGVTLAEDALIRRGSSGRTIRFYEIVAGVVMIAIVAVTYWRE